MAAALSEPQVLAHTKRHLFAEPSERSYSVCDTQFAQSEWLSGQPISSQIREDLAPFNHVEIGGGYPDLVGVYPLDETYLAADHRSSDPPLVAIEAKGHTESGSVEIEKGLQQAYTYLQEANTVYLTAPANVLSQDIQSAASELNVGILSVDFDGTLKPVAKPMIVSNQSMSAVRLPSITHDSINKS